ncbi:hypothetical protein D3C80_1613100 [compost metagenome]
MSMNEVKALLRRQAGIDGNNLFQLGFQPVYQTNLRLDLQIFRLLYRQANNAGQAYRRLAADVVFIVMDK